MARTKGRVQLSLGTHERVVVDTCNLTSTAVCAVPSCTGRKALKSWEEKKKNGDFRSIGADRRLQRFYLYRRIFGWTHL